MKLLEGVAYVLAVVTLLLLALAVYLAAGWRRLAIRSCGFVFIVIGAVVARRRRTSPASFVVDALASDRRPGSRPRTRPGRIATSLLERSRGGDDRLRHRDRHRRLARRARERSARRARRSITPFLRDRRILYPILFAIVLLVFVWSPTEGTSGLIPSLILIALLVGGAEALRRQAIAEFPDATVGALSERWRLRLEALRDRRRARPSGSAPEAGAPANDRIGQLERLAELHRSGVIDDAELQREKELVGT